MVALKGFKRAIIGIFDKDGQTVKKYEITRNQKQGGTVECDISGLAGEQEKLSAGDGDYHVEQTGIGDVKAKLTMMDLADEIGAAIVGNEFDEDGFETGGINSKAPYCSIILESTTIRDEPYYTGLFKGKFTSDSSKMATSESGKVNIESDTELEFAAIANDDGHYYKRGAGEGKLAKLEEIIFPGYKEPTVPKG